MKTYHCTANRNYALAVATVVAQDADQATNLFKAELKREYFWLYSDVDTDADIKVIEVDTSQEGVVLHTYME